MEDFGLWIVPDSPPPQAQCSDETSKFVFEEIKKVQKEFVEKFDSEDQLEVEETDEEASTRMRDERSMTIAILSEIRRTKANRQDLQEIKEFVDVHQLKTTQMIKTVPDIAAVKVHKAQSKRVMENMRDDIMQIESFCKRQENELRMKKEIFLHKSSAKARKLEKTVKNLKQRVMKNKANHEKLREMREFVQTYRLKKEKTFEVTYVLKLKIEKGNKKLDEGYDKIMEIREQNTEIRADLLKVEELESRLPNIDTIRAKTEKIKARKNKTRTKKDRILADLKNINQNLSDAEIANDELKKSNPENREVVQNLEKEIAQFAENLSKKMSLDVKALSVNMEKAKLQTLIENERAEIEKQRKKSSALPSGSSNTVSALLESELANEKKNLDKLIDEIANLKENYLESNEEISLVNVSPIKPVREKTTDKDVTAEFDGYPDSQGSATTYVDEDTAYPLFTLKKKASGRKKSIERDNSVLVRMASVDVFEAAERMVMSPLLTSTPIVSESRRNLRSRQAAAARNPSPETPSPPKVKKTASRGGRGGRRGRKTTK